MAFLVGVRLAADASPSSPYAEGMPPA